MKRKLYKILSLVLAVAILLPTALFFVPTANATSYPAGESLNYSYDFDIKADLSGTMGDLESLFEEIIFFDFYSGDKYVATVYSASGNFSCNYYITNAVMVLDLSEMPLQYTQSLGFDFTLTRNSISETITKQTKITFWKENTCEIGLFTIPTPEDYNFFEDSYNFENYSAFIPLGYFKTMYGNAKGYELWKNEWYQNGLCFGFAYTTAAFYNQFPSCNSIRNLSDSSTIGIDSIELSVDTYIKYAYIYQSSMEHKNNYTWSNASTIYNLVKKCAEDNNLCVTIGMTHNTNGGHRVLAVGIDGNDILIDDPNNKNGYERLTVNPDGSWSFSGLNGWNNNTCRIRYSLDYHGPFKFLKTLKPLNADEAFIDNTTIDSLTLEADLLSKDSLLLSVDSNEYNITNNNISLIESEFSENSSTTINEKKDLYWIETDSTVTLTNLTENSEINLAGNNTIISAITSSSDEISLTMDEQNNDIGAVLDTTSGDTYTISTTTFDDNSNTIVLNITGVATGDEITASQTDTGFSVSGISNGMVSLSKNDETVSNQQITNANGNIEITYDKNGKNDTILVDYQESHTHADENKDGICDTCGEDFSKNCSCMCHSNSFVQFIHKILCFFYKLFGMNDYRYCDCGKAHW